MAFFPPWVSGERYLMALNTFSHLPTPLSAHMLKRFQVVMYGSLFYLQNLADYVALNVRKTCRMRGWFRQVCIALP